MNEGEPIAQTTPFMVQENAIDDESIIIPITDDNNTRYISNKLSRKKPYDSLEALDKVSSNIIAGHCISSKALFQNNTLYTLSEVNVTHVYKRNMTVGETIIVEELGGRTTFGEYIKGCAIEPKAFETGQEHLPDDYKIVVGNDGFFPLKEKDEVLLFVNGTYGFIKSVSETVYGIWGTYDGKLFLQENGDFARPLPSSTDKLVFGEGALIIRINELNSLN